MEKMKLAASLEVIKMLADAMAVRPNTSKL